MTDIEKTNISNGDQNQSNQADKLNNQDAGLSDSSTVGLLKDQNTHNGSTISADKSDTKDGTQSKSQTIVKQGSKVNSKMLLIGCGIFLIIFMLLVGISFYIVLNNPQSLSNLGVDTENIKSILMVFAILLFGFLFFVGFAFAALNTYRFFTNKTSLRWKYALGMLLGFIMFVGAIGLGIVSYIKINGISNEKKYNTNDIIIAHLQVKKYENSTTLPYSRIYIGTPGLKLIGPAYFDLQINEPVFSNLIAGNNIVINKLTVDCGNGQIITNVPSDLSPQLFFDTPCLYIDKGVYEVKLTYDYFNKTQQVNQTHTIANAATINIETDYDFDIDGSKSWTLNDNKNEIIVGTAPAKLLINAQKIFTDLNIPNINIYRDIDGDNSIDKENKVNFTYYLDEPKLYNSYFSIPALQLPGIGPIYYLMRYRVNAGDVPLCKISYTKSAEKDNIYNVSINIDDKGTDIDNYTFEVIDNKTDEVLDSIDSTKNNKDITFGNAREYRVRGYFNTAEGKKGVCEGDTIDVSASYYNILTDISYIEPGGNKYQHFGESGKYSLSGSSISVGDTPTTLKIAITDIIPSIPNPEIKLFVDGNLKNPTKTNEYIFSIAEEGNHELSIQVDDKKGRTSLKKYNITVKKQSLIGVLKANTYVGFDPLVVEFDASISKLNDPTDEVVYFTWDFGDGEIRNNTSVGKIIHTYRFDNNLENGEYQPKVIIKTKKGITQEIFLDQKIIVKRAIRSFEIMSLSHPTQIAKVGETINFGLKADGQIKSISRDFGDGNTLNGPNREFSEVSNIYKKAGTYNIYVTIEYDDSSPITQNMKMIIKE